MVAFISEYVFDLILWKGGGRNPSAHPPFICNPEDVHQLTIVKFGPSGISE